MATTTPTGREQRTSARRGSPRPAGVAKQPTRAKAREGKKALVGYFSERLNRAMHDLAEREERSMQSLIGEAVDMLLVDRGLDALTER